MDTTSPHHPADAQALADELDADLAYTEQLQWAEIAYYWNCNAIGRGPDSPLHDPLAVAVGIPAGIEHPELFRCVQAGWPQLAYVGARTFVGQRGTPLTEAKLATIGHRLPAALREDWLIYCAAGINPWAAARMVLSATDPNNDTTPTWAAVRAASTLRWQTTVWRARAVWQTIVWRSPVTLATVAS